jgi:hypothetical protein
MEREDPRCMIIELGSIHAGQRVYILANKSKSDCKWKNIQLRQVNACPDQDKQTNTSPIT